MADRRITAPFEAAAQGFEEAVDQIPDGAWEQPALGRWDLRALVGHAARSVGNLPAYLAAAPSGDLLDDPVAYYLRALPSDDDPTSSEKRHRANAERGRAAGIELGEQPQAQVAALVRLAIELVRGADDKAPCQTPVGPMTLAGYLPTRTFELTVHTLDIVRAIDQRPPARLGPAIASSLELAGRLAAQRPTAADLLLLLTGRTVAGRPSVV